MQFVLGLLGKAFAAVIAFAPASFRRALGDFIGFLWFDVFKIRRAVAIENVGLSFPEKSNAEVLAIARGSMSNMGRTLTEFAHFPFFRKEKIANFFDYEGFENVTEALKKKKGVLFLSMHLGNGDMAVAASSLMGLKLNLISKRFKAQWLDRLWFGMRAKHGTKFISPEKSSFEILRALGRNEIVIFVLDQFMGPPIGVRTRFFGRETGTAMGLALVHLRTEAPLILTYTYRTPHNKMVIVFEKAISAQEMLSEIASELPELDIKACDRAKLIALLTQKYTDMVEQVVRRYPEQWMWIHRRWKDFIDN